jgi:hypothetical protein
VPVLLSPQAVITIIIVITTITVTPKNLDSETGEWRTGHGFEANRFEAITLWRQK